MRESRPWRDVRPESEIRRMLPALIDGEGPILFESLAIIEYLDQTHPNPVNIWNTNSSSMSRPASNGASIGTRPR
jgi:Glutathione S-transferase, N-terminal domain